MKHLLYTGYELCTSYSNPFPLPCSNAYVYHSVLIEALNSVIMCFHLDIFCMIVILCKSIIFSKRILCVGNLMFRCFFVLNCFKLLSKIHLCFQIVEAAPAVK